MNKTIRRTILTVTLLLLLPLLGITQQEGRAKEGRVTYFSPGSFYIYAMGTYYSGVPTEYTFDNTYFSITENAPGPIFGLGYTFVNFGDRFLINFELDAGTAKFDFSGYESTRLWNYTGMVNMEFRFNPTKSKVSAFLGLGASLFHYAHSDSRYELDYVYDSDEWVLAINLGLKARLSKNLSVRAEVRHFWTAEDWGYYDEWYDEWVTEGEEITHFGTVLAIGLELHF